MKKFNRKYFKVNELFFYNMDSAYRHNQMFDALIAFAVRYNCELSIDTLDDYREAHEIFAYCSEEDFTMIMLSCPNVIHTNTTQWINYRE
jgi:hypothetical protein